MQIISTERNYSLSTNLRNIEELLDDNRNLNLENATAEEFLELFFKLEINKRNGTELSKHTLKAYREDAKTLFSFIEARNIVFEKIAFPEVYAYNSFVIEKYAPRTANRKLLFLKRILVFGFKSKYFPENFSLWLENAPVSKGHYDMKKDTVGGDKRDVFLREIEQETALAIAKSFNYICKPIKRNMPYIDILNERNHLIGFLLYSTGMRASELLSLNFSHIEKKKNSYYLNVLGKGNKPRKVPMTGENTIKAFENFKETTEGLLSKMHIDIDIEDCPIFYNPIDLMTNKKIKRLNYNTLYKIVKQGVQKSLDIYKKYDANIELSKDEKSIAKAIKKNLTAAIKENKVSAHWFRHSYVTMLLENDVPLAVVKDLVGHADISTTNIYLEKINEEKKHEHLNDLDLGF